MGWESMNRDLDREHHQQDIDEHGYCIINQNLVCQSCGGCHDDTGRDD